MLKQIFTSNGTLTSNRTVTLNGKNLTFSTNNGSLFVNGTSGNVGIGTMLPAQKLDINGNIQAQMGIFTKSLPNNSVFSSIADRNTKSLVFTAGTLLNVSVGSRTLQFYDFPSSNFNPVPQVYFGIEDRANQGRFRFAAMQGGESQFLLFDKNQAVIYRVFDNGSDEITVHLPKGRSRMVIAGESWYLPEHNFVVRGSSKIEGNILTDSNIGIGTDSFTDGTDSYRLSVNGSVRAHRVRVYTDWADYVFDKDYKLLKIEEVEQFINKNKHLPNMPSAKDIEENGIEIGEMTKIQQEKIEELTLYLIQQQKEINQLKEQVKLLIENQK